MYREILQPILPLVTLTALVLGTIVGSFLNVVVWRLPRGESLVHPASHCPKCGHAIRPWENIPILSWLLLRARCSNCGEGISPRYPLVELATGLLFLALWWRVWSGPLPLALAWGYFYLGASLLAAGLIDLEHGIIPDRITLTGMAVGLALAAAWPAARLGQDLAGTPEGSHLILGGFLDMARGIAPAWVAPARVQALADSLLGIGFGYGMLWLLLETGKRLWGRLNLAFAPPAKADFTPWGLRLGDHLEESWENLFFRRSDRLQAEAQSVTVRGTDAPPQRLTHSDTIPIVADRNGIRIGETHHPWKDIRGVEAHLTRCVLPREVMGHGDLKLLAMIGAFLGADATVFILMLAAAAGCLLGTLGVLLRRRRGEAPLPFGPFLSGAAVFWVLAGERLLRWYLFRFL